MFEEAKKKYSAAGIDVEAALEKLKNVSISLHCWQGDDVRGFDTDPGKPKMNLHASYAIFENGEWADRDKLEPKHFAKWVEFCKERGLGCDFNPTFFSHPKCDPLTLSSPNEETRKFWIEHGKACIRISTYLAEELGQPCVMNI